MRKLPMPRMVKDMTVAMQTATPHRQKANALQEKIIGLLREVEDPTSTLSPDERAAQRQEIEELREQVRDENRSAVEPLDDLTARYPKWIKK